MRKRSVIFILALITIVTVGCSKSEKVEGEKLWRSPGGVVMSESDIPNWEVVEEEFKRSLENQQVENMKPNKYYGSRHCFSPRIRCGVECAELTSSVDADCNQASACAPCDNCCNWNPMPF